MFNILFFVMADNVNTVYSFYAKDKRQAEALAQETLFIENGVIPDVKFKAEPIEADKNTSDFVLKEYDRAYNSLLEQTKRFSYGDFLVRYRDGGFNLAFTKSSSYYIMHFDFVFKLTFDNFMCKVDPFIAEYHGLAGGRYVVNKGLVYKGLNL